MAFWLLFFTYLGSFLLSELLRPKPNIENARPAGSDEFDFPTATEGRHVPIVVGKVQLSGPNVIWYGEIEANPIQDRVKTGLFSKKTITTGYEYFAAIQMAICRGPIDELTRIWVGERVVFDRYGSPVIGSVLSPNTLIDVEENDLYGGEERGGGLNGRFEVFEGITDAPVSTFMASRTTPLPNYQNTCYVIFRDGLPVSSQGTTRKSGGYVGNTPNIKNFKFEVTRYPNNLGSPSSVAQIGDDANPIEFLYEILTDTDWGLGIDPAEINLNGTLEEGGFRAVAQQVAADGLGFSAVFESPKTARELITEIERHVDGFFRLNITTGLFEIVLARGATTSPDGAVAVDETNIIELETFSRGTWSETENEIRVTYKDRGKNYTETHALAQDMANRLVQGRSPVQLRYPGVKNGTVANKIAWRELRSMAYPLAKIKFAANRTLYALQPGDVISWSWDDYGIIDMKMRITRVGYGSDKDSRIVIDAVEDVYDLETAAFVDPPGTGWEPPNTDAVALAADEQRLIQLPIALMSSDRLATTQQVGVLAKRPSGLHVGYQIRKGPSGSETESAYTTINQAAQFTPTALLFGAVSRLDDFGGSPTITVRVDNTSLFDQIVSATFSDLADGPVNLALIDDEWIFFEDVAAGSPSGTYVLTGVRRGMLNSVPADHDDNARIWFPTYGMGLLSTSEMISGFTIDETAGIKLITETVTDTLPFASAIRIDIGPGDPDLDTSYYEFDRPYPANDPYLNGVRFHEYNNPSPEKTIAGPLTVEWVGRNRTTQIAASLGLDYDQKSAHVIPPTSVLYRLQVYRTDRSPEELVYSNTFIPPANSAISPPGAIYSIDPSNYMIPNTASPLGSPVTDFPKDFAITLAARDVGARFEVAYSQQWREEFRVTGYGLDYGENYGGVSSAGVNLAQGDPPVATVPIPGLENYREWRIKVANRPGSPNLVDSRESHFIWIQARNNLNGGGNAVTAENGSFSQDNFDNGQAVIFVDGSALTTIKSVREHISGELTAMLDTIFNIGIDGEDVVISTLYGEFNAYVSWGRVFNNIALTAVYGSVLKQEAAPASASGEFAFRGFYFGDWYEEIYDSLGRTFVLGPETDPDYGAGTTSAFYIGVFGLTYDKQKELGFRMREFTVFDILPNFYPTPIYYQNTFTDVISKFASTDLTNYGTISATRLDNTGSSGGSGWVSAYPMTRTGIVVQLDVNLGMTTTTSNNGNSTLINLPGGGVSRLFLQWNPNKAPKPYFPDGAQEIYWFNTAAGQVNASDSDFVVEIEINGVIRGTAVLGSPNDANGSVNENVGYQLQSQLDAVSGWSSEMFLAAPDFGTFRRLELRRDTPNQTADVRLYNGYGLRLHIREV
jgi:hypothetical protein